MKNRRENDNKHLLSCVTYDSVPVEAGRLFRARVGYVCFFLGWVGFAGLCWALLGVAGRC